MKFILLAILVVAVSAKDYEPLSKEHVDYVNQIGTTWKAEVNKFHSWKLEAFKRTLGVPVSAIGAPSKLPNLVHKQVKAVPDNFDAREQWPNCPTIQEVRDQGNCGSCWAFGAVEAMSDRICIASNAATIVRLSAEDMVSCCRACGFGCSGGYPESAWAYWRSTGLVTGGNYNSKEGCQPYSIEDCEHHVNGTRKPCGGSEVCNGKVGLTELNDYLE